MPPDLHRLRRAAWRLPVARHGGRRGRSAAARSSPARRAAPLTVLGLLCALLGGCASDVFQRSQPADSTPVLNRAATSAVVLNDHLHLLERLLQASPAGQAEIIAAAQHDFDLAPTPSHQLRLALVLSTPGHPARDLPKAQKLLRELIANQEMLTAGERALAELQLQQIDDILTLESENRRLQADAGRADRERLAAASKRLQAEADENSRLRRELEEARAKLDAIANIERSLNERKPSNEGRPQ